MKCVKRQSNLARTSSSLVRLYADETDLRSVAELAINLWLLVDVEGMIEPIASKAYCLTGSDAHNYDLLKVLSLTDLFCAAWLQSEQCRLQT